MIHLIGIEHKVQYMNSNWGVAQTTKDNWTHYSSIIEQSIREIQPSVVAEELNEKWLQGLNGAKSILKSAKEEHEAQTGTKIQHIFEEPDESIKDAKGYKERETIRAILKARIQNDPPPEEVMAHVIAHQAQIREECWADAIKDYSDNEILFVCGDIHLYTFRRLLAKQSINSRIVAQGIGVNCSCLADYQGLNYALTNDMFEFESCFCLGKPIAL